MFCHFDILRIEAWGSLYYLIINKRILRHDHSVRRKKKNMFFYLSKKQNLINWLNHPFCFFQVDDLAANLENTDIKEKRVSKAQKRRDKKAEKEKERDEDIARQEEENKNGLRHLETEKIKALLASRGLKVKDIPSDGDCLFAGVLHQVLDGLKVSDLRQKVGEILRRQKDDFQPFLSLDDTGYEDYCHKMATTPKWGGQVEVTALSRVLKRPLEVIQAEGPVVQVGMEEYPNEKAVVLTYHRHYYGLGEHYNSVQPLSDD